MIIRDSKGKFIAVKAKSISLVSNPYSGELIATREGLLFTWELGLKDIQLEGDSNQVYSCIQEMIEDYSYNNKILKDIFIYVSWFNSFSYCLVPRVCNNVADTIAHFTKSQRSSVLWKDDPPKFIVSLLVDELHFL